MGVHRRVDREAIGGRVIVRRNVRRDPLRTHIAEESHAILALVRQK